MKVPTQLRGSLGFAMKSMLLKKRRVMAKVEVEKRKRALIHAKKKQNYAQQVADDSVLPPLERETLVELRKGGLAASNQIRKVKRELDSLDEGFFLRLCTTLLKESLYDPAKALFVVRMQRPELYTRQTSMMLLRNAVKNEDNVFTKRVTSELLENEFHSATSTITNHSMLKLAILLARAKEVSASVTVLKRYKDLVVVTSKLERNPKKGEEKEEVEKKLNGENGENVEDGQPPRNEGLAPPRPRQTYLYVESEGREILVDGKDVEDEEEDGIHLSMEAIDRSKARAQRAEEIKDEVIQYQRIARWMGSKKKERNPLLYDYNTLIQLYGKVNSSFGVFMTLDLISLSGLHPDETTFEYIAQAMVKQVDFVKSVVSMETLPPELPEVAFVGRSNVGKSSLINMLTNRKSLAKTSNTPGKTKLFNYFEFNRGKQGGRRFYFVDMPGVGFARVPGAMSDRWTEFMRTFFRERRSLRVILHLIDSKVGVMPHDRELMKMVVETNVQSRYNIVLTKVDKLNQSKIQQAVIVKLLKELDTYGLPLQTSVIPTSSNTRIGRDKLWKLVLNMLNQKQDY